MARSKRTQKQIQDKKANKYDFVGDKEVASHLGEIEFQASTLETIDGAMMKFIDEELNLSVQLYNPDTHYKKVRGKWWGLTAGEVK